VGVKASAFYADITKLMILNLKLTNSVEASTPEKRQLKDETEKGPMFKKGKGVAVLESSDTTETASTSVALTESAIEDIVEQAKAGPSTPCRARK
jgi:hypothetical protein